MEVSRGRGRGLGRGRQHLKVENVIDFKTDLPTPLADHKLPKAEVVQVRRLYHLGHVHCPFNDDHIVSVEHLTAHLEVCGGPEFKIEKWLSEFPEKSFMCKTCGELFSTEKDLVFHEVPCEVWEAEWRNKDFTDDMPCGAETSSPAAFRYKGKGWSMHFEDAECNDATHARFFAQDFGYVQGEKKQVV